MRRPLLRNGTARLLIGLAALGAIGACGSTQPSGPTISDLETPTASLVGAGSTFDQPFFARAFARYEQLNPSVKIQYAAQGSTFGIEALQAGTVDFGASDVPMTPGEMSQARGGTVLQIPVALGGEAVSYNLDGVTAGMHLTGTVLANIYLGRITRWDDPAITNLNPTVSLPHEAITVVHRSDGSGTTYIFTDFLSGVSPAWGNGPGRGKSVAWPLGIGASGNQGVANVIRSTPGAIGYVELAYALQNDFTFARILNNSGFYVLPLVDTVATAAAQKPDVSATDFSIVDEPGPQSYPISGYSWAVVYERQTSPASGQALVKMLDWLTQDDGQAEAAAIQYVPLPANVSQLARSTLARVTDGSGRSLLYG